MADLYVSVDVESDGPIPGEYSLLSIGATVVGVREPDGTFTPVTSIDAGFYAELRPTGQRSDPHALAVSGLDLGHLRLHGQDPSDAMTAFGAWVSAAGERWSATPVFCAWPAVFDWMFVRWYFVRYAQHADPFGYGTALDMKTHTAALLNVPVTAGVKDRLPAGLQPDAPLTHNALADAEAQGVLFARVLTHHQTAQRAQGRRRPRRRTRSQEGAPPTR